MAERWAEPAKIINSRGDPLERIYLGASPLAAWPRSKNVLGYEPWPQILNEPKSLYQSPSGTSGCCSIQTKLVEVGKADGPVAHAIYQVLTHVCCQILPVLNPRH